VLAGVLLNVIEAAGPVDSALYRGANRRRWSLYYMKHGLALVDAFNDPSAVKRSRIARLSAARGIKSCAVERDCGPAADSLRYLNDARVKLDQMRIGVIETFGYRHEQLINNPNNPSRARVMAFFDSFSRSAHNRAATSLAYAHCNFVPESACMNANIRIFLSRLVAGGSLVIALAGIASAQQPVLRSIDYRLSMSRPISHFFEVAIEVEFAEDAKVESLEFQMPKWSPGRYAVFDFAKNVQEFQAYTLNCSPRSDAPSALNCQVSPFPVTRVDDQTWRVETQRARRLTVSYKIFANDLSGTFSQLDTRHANYNGGCIFMYVVDHKQDPVRLAINPPPGWRIVNGRMEKADQREWQFPNWDIMIDTPTEIAPDWTVDDFQVAGKTYHVVVHSFGNEGGKRPALVRDIESIVRAETAMWGPPEFDSYTFLIHFAADDHSGDGMEHLTSTQIIQPGALGESGVFENTLGTVAHEFFHVWNVKRLRPAELGPWDFTRPANTRGLWVAEGLTNYYGHLMLRRAGIWDDKGFLNRESQTVTGIENAPGSRLMSAEESSLSAPFLDDAPHAQHTNLENSSISYYPKGELLGMVLDLLIRGKTHGKASLDDVMRKMYEEFYLKSPNASYYLRGRGYKTEDFERVASEVAEFDLHDFFTRYVRGVEVPPYDEAFAYAGLRLVRETAREPYNAGIRLDWENQRSIRIGNVVDGSPAEDAGLQSGDEILSLGGRTVTRDGWLVALNQHKQGDRVPITVKRDRRTVEATLVLRGADRFEYRIEEKKDATAEEKALRSAWLKGN
jgi:predicted metalloprotease with PDZ domain